jgi:hypothetical protein
VPVQDLDGASSASVCNEDGGGAPDPGSSGAPSDARYWVGAAASGLSAEHNLGALSTGLVKNTAGVPSTATGGTTSGDYSTVFVGSTSPAALGSANSGASSQAARADHVHPTTGLVTTSRQVIAGTGLSGGGALSSDVTLSMPNIGPGAGTIGGGGNVITSVTLDAQGRVTAATSGAAGGSGYTTVENNGTPVTQRSTINLSTEFAASDASSKTALALATNGVAFAKIAQLAGLSVLGVTGSSTANMAAITAGADGQGLFRAGTSLGFSYVADANISGSAAIQLAKLANITGPAVLGKTGTGSGAITTISAGTTGHVLRHDGTVVGFGTLLSGSFADGTISGARLSGLTNAQVVIGTSGGGVQSLAAGTNTHVLTMVAGVPAWAAAAGGVTAGAGAAAGRSAFWTSATEINGSAKWLYDDTVVSMTVGTLTDSLPLNLHLKSGTDVDCKILFEENGHAAKPWAMGVDASDSHKFIVQHGSSTLGSGTISLKFQSSSGDVEALTDWNFTKAGSQNFTKEGTGNLQFRTAATGQEISFRPKLIETLVLTDDGVNGIARLLGNTAINGSGSFGSGVGVVFMGNRTTAPTTNPSGGGLMYAESGGLKWRDSAGVVTALT